MSAKQSCAENSPFTDYNKTHFCCKFWIHSLDMKPFDWSEWYMWLKMAFKMSQEFPMASMDITKDFHILHSAYVYICYSIPHAKTYNWPPNTHTTHTHTPAKTTNKRQLGTVDRLLMVIWLAQTLLSCAKFWLLRVLKKGDDFADTGLAVETPAGSAPAKACFKLLHWFGKRHKMDAFTKLGEPTQYHYQSCMYPTDSAWPAFLMPFLLLLPVSGHVSCSFTVPPTKRAHSVLHPHALTKCSPLNF